MFHTNAALIVRMSNLFLVAGKREAVGEWMDEWVGVVTRVIQRSGSGDGVGSAFSTPNPP